MHFSEKTQQKHPAGKPRMFILLEPVLFEISKVYRECYLAQVEVKNG